MRQIAYRYWNPDEHGVAPHRHGFNHGPTLADACVAQDDPEHQGHANAVRIHQSDCRAQQRKVILDWVRGQVGDDGVGERGRDEQGEDERGERPERPVEVGRGREVGGRVCGREGVERVDAAKEYLVTQSDAVEIQFSEITQGRREGDLLGERTDGFGVNVEMVLIVVYVPEGRVASVRDVACSTAFNIRVCLLSTQKGDCTSSLALSRRRATDVACRRWLAEC